MDHAKARRLLQERYRLKGDIRQAKQGIYAPSGGITQDEWVRQLEEEFAIVDSEYQSCINESSKRHKEESLTAALIWLDDVARLSELFGVLKDKGYIETDSETDLYRRVASHFRVKGGYALDAETLRKSRYQLLRRKGKEGEFPFSEWLSRMPSKGD